MTDKTIRFKEKGIHYVVYAEETKCQEFTSKKDADEFAEYIENEE